jgi:hypothetical protein
MELVLIFSDIVCLHQLEPHESSWGQRHASKYRVLDTASISMTLMIISEYDSHHTHFHYSLLHIFVAYSSLLWSINVHSMSTIEAVMYTATNSVSIRCVSSFIHSRYAG